MTKEFLSDLGLSEESIDRVLCAYREAMDKKVAEHQSQLQSITMQNALAEAIHQSGAHDAKAVTPFLDLSAITWDQGAFTGLDEQLQLLQKTKGFLFRGDADHGGKPLSLSATGLSHGLSPTLNPASMTDDQYYAAFGR